MVRDGKLTALHGFEDDGDPSSIANGMVDTLDDRCRIPQPMVRNGWLEQGVRSDRSRRGAELFAADATPRGVQGQRLPGAGHGHVVEPARRVGVFVLAESVPATIEHHHMIELQSLGAVRGHQQESALAAAHVPSPLCQPLDEVLHRHLRFAAGLQRVLVHRFAHPGADLALIEHPAQARDG